MQIHSISTTVLIAAVCLSASLPARGDIPFDKFTSNAPLDGEVFLLVNTSSGRCLTEKEGRVSQGVVASDATAQDRWKLVRVGDDYAIINQKSGKLLTLPGASKIEGTDLTATSSEKNDSMSQQWVFEKVGNHYRIRAQATGMVVAVAEASKAKGFRVLQWTWNEGSEQVWMVQWVPGAGKK
ncbi:MAG: RICIN domain-containing protein [Planctomycetota bacterium]